MTLDHDESAGEKANNKCGAGVVELEWWSWSGGAGVVELELELELQLKASTRAGKS
jgi:hypothetical protein